MSGFFRNVAKQISDAITAFSVAIYAALLASGGAALIGFIQLGAGAIWRTAQDKMREKVSVEDFGATGAGDDSVAIQNAVNASNGKWIFGDPSKTYPVTNISLPTGARLKDLKLKSNPSATLLASVLLIDGVTAPKSNIRIKSVEIDGNRDFHTAIAYPSSEDGGRHGIRVIGHVSDLQITKSSAKNCATDGLELYSGGGGVTGAEGTYTFNDILIKDCDFSGNRRMGISADSHKNIRVIRTKTNGNGLPTALANTAGHTLNTDGSWAAWVVAPSVPAPSYGNGMDFEGYGMGSGFENLYLEGNNSVGNGGESYAFRENASVGSIAGYILRGPLTMIGNKGTSGLAGGLTNGVVFSQAAGTLSSESTWKYVTMDANVIAGPVKLESILRLKMSESNQIFCAGVAPLIRYCTEYTVAKNIFFDTTSITVTGSRSTLQNAAYHANAAQSFTASADNILIASAADYDPAFCVTAGTTFTARYPGTFRIDIQSYFETGGGTLTIGYKKNGGVTVPCATYVGTGSYFAYRATDFVLLNAGDTMQFTVNPSIASTVGASNSNLIKFAVTQVQ